jgi:AcrR family transcriptional regulator
MSAPRRTAARRGYGRLDRPTIVAVPLAIARAKGLPAVTMRAIAEELGSSPMALYRHVADREALVIAMLDAVAADIDVPPPCDDPRTEIISLVSAVHHVLHKDPWAVSVQVIEGLASPVVLPVVDRLFAALFAAGLTPADAGAASRIIWDYTYGELLGSHHDQPDHYRRRMVREADPQRYPALAKAVRASPPEGVGEQFPLGIEIVVDGLLARLGP